MMEGPFKTLAEIREQNERSGRFWFDPLTVEAFDSIWDEEVIGGRYFVSGEDYGVTRAPLRWSIRRATDDGAIETIGPTGAYQSRMEAKNQARFLSEAGLRLRPETDYYPCEGFDCAARGVRTRALFELPTGEGCLKLCPNCIPTAVSELLRPNLSNEGPTSDISPDDGIVL